VSKFKTLKGVCLVAAASMLPISQAAIAEVSISGWINQGIQFWDDGDASDATALHDNGNTLGDRLTFTASSEVATGLTGGIELITEFGIFNASLGGDNNQEAFSDSNNTNSTVTLLSSNVWLSGAWGKLTAGTQSMPTDNIAVLEDPSLTLWSSISPVFHNNAKTLKGTGFGVAGANGLGTTNFGGTATADAALWGNFLGCYTQPGLRGAVGIGIDCNGTYRTGIRYDLPAFGPVSIAIGYANDDVYDIMAKWKGNLGRMNASVALGYAINQGTNGPTGAVGTATVLAAFAAGTAGPLEIVYFDEAENFQIQAGLMDPETGLFGSIAYQHEENDIQADAQAAVNALLGAGVAGTLQDDTDAWWLKVGIKKQWFGLGDTALSFQYGQYEDQYGVIQAVQGVTGSEVERIGVSIDQYLGSSMIIYASWENLDLDVDTTPGSDAGFGSQVYGGVDDIDSFTLGMVYFF